MPPLPARSAAEAIGDPRDAVTVGVACRVALPGSRVLGGAAGLGRRVTWATALRSRPPAFELRGGGELVLASAEALESLRQVDPSLTPARLLEGLSEAGGVALVLPAGTGAGAAASADALGVPLVELPRDTSLLEAERGIIALVLDRRNELQTRASQLYRRLAQLSVESRGLETLLREAAAATGRIVALEDHLFRLRVVAAPPGEATPETDSAGLSSVDERGRLAEAFRSQPLSSTTPPTALVPAARWGLARYAAPVVTRERLRGFVSICCPAAGMTEFDQLAAGRTAAVCAIELAKEDAVLAAEQRVQGDVIDELLRPQADPDLLARRAQQAGLAPAGAYAVIVLAAQSAEPGQAADDASVAAAAEAAARALRRAGLPALVRAAAGEVVLICAASDVAPRAEAPSPPAPLPGTGEGRAAVEMGKSVPLARPDSPSPAPGRGGQGVRAPAAVDDATLRRAVQAAFAAAVAQAPDGRLSGGVSRAVPGLIALGRAAREAQEALRIGRRVYGSGRLVAYADLGLYRVLHALRDSPELRAFYEQMLEALVEYDRRTGQEAFVDTLEAFFACNGNISQAALRLNLHRNTLLYRVGKIQEIGGFDLEDPETRLSLQVALKARRLLT